MHSEGREKKGMFFPAFAPSSKNFKKFIVWERKSRVSLSLSGGL
jgi:hypothetical protein